MSFFNRRVLGIKASQEVTRNGKWLSGFRPPPITFGSVGMIPGYHAAFPPVTLHDQWPATRT